MSTAGVLYRIPGITAPYGTPNAALVPFAASKLGVPEGDIASLCVLYSSVERNPGLLTHFTVCVSVRHPERVPFLHKIDNITLYTEPSLSYPPAHLRPVIVGAGPAGIFAALYFARCGAFPIVLERGGSVFDRCDRVAEFVSGGKLDPECGVQFGFGGAGAFSDGKLKIGMPDERKTAILKEFVAAGAPPEIMYTENPHIGTDRLKTVLSRLQALLPQEGAELRLNTRVTGLIINNGRVEGVYTDAGPVRGDCVLLAAGHSSRDTYAALARAGIEAEPRPFGIGVRIEHPQKLINRMEFGTENLPFAADYHRVSHIGDRTAYTFCNCPGGTVVCAASEAGGVVTNGMSNYARDGANANAALLVSVFPQDYGGGMGGISLQKETERRAFDIGGDYRAPAVLLKDFLTGGMSSSFGQVLPTYGRGTVFARAKEFLPDFVIDTLRAGIADMERWRPGFLLSEAVITGVETRSTSPIRLPRGDDMCSVSVDGLYPCGEGSGYGGGIVSSAADGIRCAQAACLRFGIKD